LFLHLNSSKTGSIALCGVPTFFGLLVKFTVIGKTIFSLLSGKTDISNCIPPEEDVLLGSIIRKINPEARCETVIIQISLSILSGRMLGVGQSDQGGRLWPRLKRQLAL
jgi:hypothetical protein